MLLLATLVWAGLARAQEASETKPAEPSQAHGRLVLVLPFENRSDDKSLDWMSSAFPDVLNRRLGSAGFLTINRSDRLYAYDHLGLPTNLQPTRATAIRIAQMLDADYVVFGHFAKANDAAANQLTAEAVTSGRFQSAPEWADPAAGRVRPSAADDQQPGLEGGAAAGSNPRRG